MVSPTRVVGGGWTPESYTDFAMRCQLRSMWTLANDIADRVPLGVGRALDAGAGPAILSRFVAAVLDATVDAACQPGFGLPAGEFPDLPGVVRRHPLSYLTESAGQFPLVFSYGYFHETSDRVAFLRALAGRVAPGGALVVVDTLADAHRQVQRALARAGVAPPAARAILHTFAGSLTLSELRRIKDVVLPDAVVGQLDFAEELIMTAELSMPEGFDEDLDLDVSEPTLGVLSWVRPARRHREPAVWEEPAR